MNLPESLNELDSLVQNYRLNLIDVNRIDDLNKYPNEIKALFGFNKYQNDSDNLQKFMDDNEAYFTNVPANVARTLAVIIGAQELVKMLPESKKETVNMGTAWQQIKRKNENIGFKKGETQGLEKGRDTALEEVIMSMLKLNYPIPNITQITKSSVEQIEAIKKRMK